MQFPEGCVFNMKKPRVNKYLLIVIVIIAAGFLIYAYKNFKVSENFSSIPLNFNPTDSVSTYNWNGSQITIKGGFVKGKIVDNKEESLILRSLSPAPEIIIKGNKAVTLHIRLENINPTSTTFSNIERSKISTVDAHTVLFSIGIIKDQEKIIKAVPKDGTEGFEFVMLGDNRDGYETFSQILDQINAINPVFTVDDGDLVFGGEPHKYRLFYQLISKSKVPIYTTLGNHDIRENGRPTYTKLFGPPYYSFDYKNTHFVFLDSSRGFTEKTAIPKEQYNWLENDLKNARGKRILVFSHIPPTDPRTLKDKNNIPDIPEEEKPSLIERIMNNYSSYKNLNHGFISKDEAKKFEEIMTKYKVDTVFLSHIHSYFSYVKDNVRYVISGGAGAELLTKDSYYHYLRVKVTDKDTYLEAVELPSPVNTLQDRYIAAAALFANALFIEYRTVVISIGLFILSILALIIWNKRKRLKIYIIFWAKFLSQIFKTILVKYREIKKDVFKD